MNTVNQGDAVTLTGTVINTYVNGTARIQLQPSLACYDVQVQDMTSQHPDNDKIPDTAPAAPLPSSPLTATTAVAPRSAA